ncbi:sterol desaturase family protein [Atopomonas hussainii]|uniref:sterol desaturase family protein n=1 Tax=Atopomonas hussainii TaxID=1429083 RepID=UPI0009003D0F|nr:sterol desaturase family protein [Atopomonas hussainii]
MEWLNALVSRVSEQELFGWELWVDDGFFVVAMLVFVVELIRLAIKRQLSWNMLGDSVTNFITLAAFITLSAVLIAGFYTTVFYVVYENFSLFQLPMTWWTVLGCLILADLAYYWEHRFLHRVGFAWATHTVHHSSPYFNISVAYRFGPLDGFFPLFFYLPLAALGFHPAMIFLCEVVVQVYQTLLHTEAVGKLPRPIEAVMNTPSHHRVHHATNRQYLDKNYAGILIIWDRMFGSFAEEQETVRYGVYPRINSINPLVVFFHGYAKLCRQVVNAKSVGEAINYLIKPPGWAWEQAQLREREAQSAAVHKPMSAEAKQ